MHHAAIWAVPVFFRQDARHILVRRAGVDDQRQPGDTGSGDMDAQAVLLHGPGVGGVMVVQPGFPDADEPGVPRQGDKLVHRCHGFFRRAHRVGAGGVEDALMRLGQGAHIGLKAQAGADGDHPGDAGRAGAGQDIGKLTVKIGEVEVAVAVDEGRGNRHGWLTSGRACPPSRRSSAPYP